MRFVANLRQETLDAFSAEAIKPAAYLLSAHRLSPSMLEQAAQVRALNLPLFADNGIKSLIDELMGLFETRAKAITAAVKEIRRRVGRSPRGRDVPASLRKEAGVLAEEVVDAADGLSRAIDTDNLLDSQLSMSPTGLIAQEDFATGVLIALDLEREITAWDLDRFATRNKHSLRLWKKVANDPRCGGVDVYVVLSAMDFNTAREAGRLAARAGATHAALGFAGINHDLNATDYYVLGRSQFFLDSPVPRRYLRLAQIVKGLTLGYRDEMKALEHFHCLGLGAAAMFPIVAATFGADTQITADATSPIHDAVRDHVLYHPVSRSRSSIREIVQAIIDGDDWPFSSPFTQTFRERFGHDPERARRWAQRENVSKIEEGLLGTVSDLTQALPLFSKAEAEMFSRAWRCWVAHNHWVLDTFALELSAPDRQEKAKSILRSIVESAPMITVTTRGLKAALQVIENPIA